VRRRHNKGWLRLSLRNHKFGWGIHSSPDWTGVYSLEWYEKMLKEKKPCLD